ncbi:hypothetical protein MACK_003620 [Theileria orientalis]|uniref:Uncharacterized protein n=1 Tax=Theileria orientalis TaxID=68886 RepID=A0A976SJJ0_THEOR|nr:hypothetical protein MACK_003620 [Theileria orientalis]
MIVCIRVIWLFVYLLNHKGNNIVKCIEIIYFNNTQTQNSSDVITETVQPLQNDVVYSLIELDIHFKQTDHYVTYKKDPRTEREKFTCKPGYLVCRVVKNGHLIAEARNEQYFDRVIIYKDQAGNKNLRCMFPGNIDEEDPDELLPGPILIAVDIKNFSSSPELAHAYNEFDGSHTFTANQGYLIDKVTKRDRVLWDANYYGSECAISVYVGLNELGEKIFRVNFPKQVPILPPILPDLKLKPHEIVLDVLEFLHRKFDRKKSPERSKYHVMRMFNDLDYWFSPTIRCVRVTRGNVKVWDKGERGIVFPNSVSYIIDLDQVVVRNKRRGVIFQRYGDRMYYVSTSVYANFDTPDYFGSYYPQYPNDSQNFTVLDPEDKLFTQSDLYPAEALHHNLVVRS